VTEPEVPPTNNGSERDLRPGTTFRKVTNGFRSDWGADLYAGVRSVRNTARRQTLSPLQAIQRTLEGTVIFDPG
jgi:transposase